MLLLGTGVTVNAVIPGIVETNIRRHFSPHSNFISGTIMKPIWLFLYKTPVLGAQTTLLCALDPALATQTGKLFK